MDIYEADTIYNGLCYSFIEWRKKRKCTSISQIPKLKKETSKGCSRDVKEVEHCSKSCTYKLFNNIYITLKKKSLSVSCELVFFVLL